MVHRISALDSPLWVFFSSTANGVSESYVGLTVCLRLGTVNGGRAPQVHPRVRDVGSPGEIDDVNIIENQTLVLETRIDPVHIAATGSYETIAEKPEEDGAAVNILRPVEKYKIKAMVAALSHRCSQFSPVKTKSELWMRMSGNLKKVWVELLTRNSWHQAESFPAQHWFQIKG